MTRLEQLQKWVLGDSLHNDVLNECCPDFSCCSGAMAADENLRERYLLAIKNSDSVKASGIETDLIRSALKLGIRVKSAPIRDDQASSKKQIPFRFRIRAWVENGYQQE